MSLYVTISEFKQAPTAIDVSTLDSTALGNQNAQDAALLSILRRASDWVDNIVNMETLEATTNIEVKEVRFTRDLRLNIHPDNIPILNVKSVAYRLAPNSDYMTVDASLIQSFENWFSVYGVNTGMIGQNLYVNIPVGYTNPYYKDRLLEMPVSVMYTYINGYFHSSLTANATVGATTIYVSSTVGLSAGSTFTIYDGATEERCVVATVNSNYSITLQNGLLFAHSSGTGASAIPSIVKTATILLASYLIKERGSVALTMNQTALGAPNVNFSKSEDVVTAKQLLKQIGRGGGYS